MGRGTWADGAIVLAYRQGGGDCAVRAESREPTLGSERGLSAPPLCPSLSCVSRSCETTRTAPAPCEAVFLQVMGGGAGWDKETEKKHVNIIHSSPNIRALRLSPLVLLPLPLPLLSRSPPPGAAGRLTSPAMPAAPLRNHATLTTHTTHISCANCTLICPHTRQSASQRGADSRAVR